MRIASLFLASLFDYVPPASAQAGYPLTQTAELLISKIPAARPTPEELSKPCVTRGSASETQEVADLLGTRRVYSLALIVWGMKWLPGHATLARNGCTDFIFVQMQLQRAYGATGNGLLNKSEVEQLISQVEPMAQYLVSSGQFDKVILERIPK